MKQRSILGWPWKTTVNTVPGYQWTPNVVSECAPTLVQSYVQGFQMVTRADCEGGSQDMRGILVGEHHATSKKRLG